MNNQKVNISDIFIILYNEDNMDNKIIIMMYASRGEFNKLKINYIHIKKKKNEIDNHP